MYLSFGKVCLSIRTSSCVLVAVMETGVHFEVVFATRPTSTSNISVNTIGNSLELYVTTIAGRHGMPRMLKLMTPASRRRSTTILSTIGNIAFAPKSVMPKWNTVLQIISIEFFEADQGCKFFRLVGERSVIQIWYVFRLSLDASLILVTAQRATVCVSIFQWKLIQNRVNGL